MITVEGFVRLFVYLFGFVGVNYFTNTFITWPKELPDNLVSAFLSFQDIAAQIAFKHYSCKQQLTLKSEEVFKTLISMEHEQHSAPVKVIQQEKPNISQKSYITKEVMHVAKRNHQDVT